MYNIDSSRDHLLCTCKAIMTVSTVLCYEYNCFKSMQQSHSFYHWYTVTYILREVLSYSTRHHFSHISKQSFVICGHIKVLCFNHHSFQSVIILNYRAVMSHITGGNNGRSPTLVGQGWQATGTNLWAKLVLKKLNICAMIICQCLVFENKTDDFWVREEWTKRLFHAH